MLGTPARRRPRSREDPRRAHRPDLARGHALDQGREDGADRRRRREGQLRARRRQHSEKSTRRCWCPPIGRRPNGQIPGSARRPRWWSTRKAIIGVDAQRRTAEPTLYATATSRRADARAHKATYEGKDRRRGDRRAQSGLRAARDSRGGLHRSRARLVRVPEQEAQRRQHSVRLRSRSPVGRLRPRHVNRPHRRVTKILFDPKTERVLGVGIRRPPAPAR